MYAHVHTCLQFECQVRTPATMVYLAASTYNWYVTTCRVGSESRSGPDGLQRPSTWSGTLCFTSTMFLPCRILGMHHTAGSCALLTAPASRQTASLTSESPLSLGYKLCVLLGCRQAQVILPSPTHRRSTLTAQSVALQLLDLLPLALHGAQQPGGRLRSGLPVPAVPPVACRTTLLVRPAEQLRVLHVHARQLVLQAQEHTLHVLPGEQPPPLPLMPPDTRLMEQPGRSAERHPALPGTGAMLHLKEVTNSCNSTDPAEATP